MAPHDEQCWIHRLMRTQGECDDALMGPAHAATGVAAFLAVLAFGATFTAYFVTNSPTVGIIALSLLAFVAGALIPDFDNTSSTAKSAMGIFGEPITVLFRESSRLVQTIHTKADAKSRAKSHDYLHRGFWHSLMGAVALALVVNLATSNPIVTAFKLPLGFIGIHNLGALIAAIICLAAMHIALSGLNIGALKGGKHLNSMVTFIVSLVITGALFASIPAGQYTWIGYSMGAGAVVHIIGDMFTKSGVPLLAPIVPRKGKLWYTYRVATYDAKSPSLNSGVLWLSIGISVLSLLILLPRIFGH